MRTIIIILIILLLDFTTGTILSPAISEAPIATNVQELEKQIRKLKKENFQLKKGIIDFGLKVDLEGRVWR